MISACPLTPDFSCAAQTLAKGERRKPVCRSARVRTVILAAFTHAGSSRRHLVVNRCLLRREIGPRFDQLSTGAGAVGHCDHAGIVVTRLVRIAGRKRGSGRTDEAA
jgi:hypothetical protein